MVYVPPIAQIRRWMGVPGGRPHERQLLRFWASSRMTLFGGWVGFGIFRGVGVRWGVSYSSR